MTYKAPADQPAVRSADDQKQALERIKNEMLSLQGSLTGASQELTDDTSVDAASRLASALEAIFSSRLPEADESNDDSAATPPSVQTGTVAPASDVVAPASTTGLPEGEEGNKDDSATRRVKQ
jgi:hypothetical protein